MRAYPTPMGTRPILTFILTLAVLFASAFTGAAAASAAAMPGHDMQMMEMGHCSSPPASHEGKSMPKQCCLAMCMAVAIAPSAPDELLPVTKSAATFALPTSHKGFLGEIATPPPRVA